MFKKNKGTADEIKKLTEYVSDKLLKKDDDSNLSVLDDTKKAYIKNRFPLTNDDTLRKDYANAVLTRDGDQFEIIRNLGKESEKIETIILNQLPEKHKELEEKYLIIKDVNKLLEIAEFLRSSLNASEHFNLTKSSSDKEEIKKQSLDEINEIEEGIKELLEKGGEKSLDDLEKKYQYLHKRYTTIANIWNNKNQNLN